MTARSRSVGSGPADTERTKDGGSEMLPCAFERYASRDALGPLVLERMLARVSTRRSKRTR